MRAAHRLQALQTLSSCCVDGRMENLVDSGFKVYSVVECPEWGELQCMVKDLCGLHSHFWGSDKINSFPVCRSPAGFDGNAKAKYDNPGFRLFAGMHEATYPLFRDALLPLMAGAPDKEGTCKTNGLEWGVEWTRYHEVSERMSKDGLAQKLAGDLFDFLDANRPKTFLHGDFNPGNIW